MWPCLLVDSLFILPGMSLVDGDAFAVPPFFPLKGDRERNECIAFQFAQGIRAKESVAKQIGSWNIKHAIKPHTHHTPIPFPDVNTKRTALFFLFFNLLLVEQQSKERRG